MTCGKALAEDAHRHGSGDAEVNVKCGEEVEMISTVSGLVALVAAIAAVVIGFYGVSWLSIFIMAVLTTILYIGVKWPGIQKVLQRGGVGLLLLYYVTQVITVGILYGIGYGVGRLV